MLFTTVLIISLYLFTAIFVFGRSQPGYSHIKHTISELGETGSLKERTVNYAVFLVVGMNLLLLCVYVHYTLTGSISKAYSGMFGSVAIGYITAAFFPCDPGCPLEGSRKQVIHNAGGFVEYMGGAYFMFKIPELQVIASLILVLVILMSLPLLFQWRGLIQRLAEISLFASLTWTGLRV